MLGATTLPAEPQSCLASRPWPCPLWQHLYHYGKAPQHTNKPPYKLQLNQYHLNYGSLLLEDGRSWLYCTSCTVAMLNTILPVNMYKVSRQPFNPKSKIKPLWQLSLWPHRAKYKSHSHLALVNWRMRSQQYNTNCIHWVPLLLANDIFSYLSIPIRSQV